jgi:hypothetical protein
MIPAKNLLKLRQDKASPRQIKIGWDLQDFCLANKRKHEGTETTVGKGIK